MTALLLIARLGVPRTVALMISPPASAPVPGSGLSSVTGWPGADLSPVLAAFAEHHPTAPVELVTAAFTLADVAHAPVRRKSGEPYIVHPLGVALILAQLGMDAQTVAAGLCHDVVEDTEVTVDELAAALDPTVAKLVDGVTKLDQVAHGSAGQRQAGNLRKLLLAATDDLRCLIIKVADRADNVRTLAVLDPARQHRIATETLEVYAPLAHRLGMGALKAQLEDCAFVVLHPERYAQIDAMLTARAPKAEAQLVAAADSARAALAEAGLNATVLSRAKHHWSVYNKMVVRGRAFDDIRDLLGMRVIVDSVDDCYRALGVLHGRFSPVSGRFADFIAQPRFNSYASLHTTILDDGGNVLELQIRTAQMHAQAEVGLAAHWRYKNDDYLPASGPAAAGASLPWLARLLPADGDSVEDPDEFLASLRSELGSGEVVVLTPAGRIVELAAGATAIDFAYAIHSEVGHAAVGARVNGELVPLATGLRPGDTVDVVTGPAGSGPRAEWLSVARTGRARHAIRSALNTRVRGDALAAGREMLASAAHRAGLPAAVCAERDLLAAAAAAVGCGGEEELYAALADGRVPAERVAQELADALAASGRSSRVNALGVAVAIATERAGVGGLLVVDSDGTALLRMAGCCLPVPGEPVLGQVLAGGVVAVHRQQCAAAAGSRTVEVSWVSQNRTAKVRIEALALDRSGLLAQVAATLSEAGVNILGVWTRTGSDQVAHQRFEFTIADSGHLERVLDAVRAVDGVFTVRRIATGLADPV